MKTRITIKVAKTTALRTSSDAASTTSNADLVSPSARFCLSLRTMFSTSMIASSTTSPIAITRPARTIVLIVVPIARRITPAATSESGMAVRLIRAVRQSKRKPIEDHDHQAAADEHRVAEVVDRPLDERRGSEDRRVNIHAFILEVERGQGLLDAQRHVERVPLRLLLDDQK